MRLAVPESAPQQLCATGPAQRQHSRRSVQHSRSAAAAAAALTAIFAALGLTAPAAPAAAPKVTIPRSEKYRYRIDPSLDTGVKTERSVNDPPKFSGDRKSFDGWLTLLITKMGSTTFTDHQEGLKWMT
jgi:hypothetical protein